MPKYGQAKYGTFKYGRYLKAQPGAIGRVITYRFSARGGSMIITQNDSFDGQVSIVRMKAEDGQWVVATSLEFDGNPYIIRIKAVGSTESPWVVATKAILEEGS